MHSLLRSVAVLVGLGLTAVGASAQDRPNFLWLTIEDTSASAFSCYGNPDTRTPNVDALAARGIRFTQARATAPHCSPARSTIVSGTRATTWGTDWHRQAWPVPDDHFYLPRLLRAAGYFTSNNSKTDYNAVGFDELEKEVWDALGRRASYHDERRAKDQPFFAVFNSTITHLSRVRSHHLEGRRDFEGLSPDELTLPPHVPDLPEIRSDYGFHLEGVQDVDRWVGIFLDDLQEGGLAEDTIVFFYSDHGGCLPRGKGYPFESGFRVPLIVWVPERWQDLCGLPMGQTSNRLVGFEDLMPTVLTLAGLEVPAHCNGRDFLSKDATDKPWQFCFRTNHGKHYGPVRTVTDGRWKYIRSFIPYQPFGNWQNYQWGCPSHIAWHRAYHIGGDLQEPWLRHMLPHPAEMLFDLDADPWELDDLAGDPAQAERLTRMRGVLAHEMRTSRDLGLIPFSMRADGDDSPLVDRIDETHFPLEDLLSAAERASLGGPHERDAMARDLGHARPEFRYWAAVGLARLASQDQLGDLSSGRLEDMLRTAMAETNDEIAAQAAAALVFAGSTGPALERLADLMDGGSEAAASTLETLGTRIRPLAARLAESPATELAMPLLCLLGLADYSEAYGPNAGAEGLKVNQTRRKWEWPAPRGRR